MISLYEHQNAELEATKDLTHVAYYHDMGLGKTFTGAEKLKRLGARVNLVICQKSKVQDWIEHFKEHYAQDFRIYDLTDAGALHRFVDNVDTFRHFDVSQAPNIVGIINYDLAWRRDEIRKLNGSGFTLMLDESSLIQNESAKRSKFILHLQPDNVILLSGTPTGGKYERLWSQMRLLGWDISKKMYWAQYVNVEYLDTIGGRSIPIVKGYKNVDRLRRKMAKYGCRFLKSDEVFDMPKQTFTKVYVDSSSEYRRFKKDRIVTVNGVELVGDTTLTKMLYERQLCGQFSADKLKAFSDLIESTEDRLIVFYNFNAELDAMKAVCKEHEKPISVISGQVKDMAGYFMRDDSVTLVQYAAGAMGLNLQLANKIVYFTLPLSSELFEQSKKRIHRIGQNRPCFYYVLMCRNSVEQRIFKALEERRDYTEKLFEKGE